MSSTFVIDTCLHQRISMIYYWSGLAIIWKQKYRRGRFWIFTCLCARWTAYQILNFLGCMVMRRQSIHQVWKVVLDTLLTSLIVLCHGNHNYKLKPPCQIWRTISLPWITVADNFLQSWIWQTLLMKRLGCSLGILKWMCLFMRIIIEHLLWQILFHLSLILGASIMPQNLFFCEEIHKRGVKLNNIITMEQLGDIFTKWIPRYGF